MEEVESDSEAQEHIQVLRWSAFRESLERDRGLRIQLPTAAPKLLCLNVHGSDDIVLLEPADTDGEVPDNIGALAAVAFRAFAFAFWAFAFWAFAVAPAVQSTDGAPTFRWGCS